MSSLIRKLLIFSGYSVWQKFITKSLCVYHSNLCSRSNCSVSTSIVGKELEGEKIRLTCTWRYSSLHIFVCAVNFPEQFYINSWFIASTRVYWYFPWAGYGGVKILVNFFLNKKKKKTMLQTSNHISNCIWYILGCWKPII